MGLLKNYLSICVRNLLTTRTYSAINICGLAAGMTVAILIGLWVFDEMNYNRSFDNYNRLAQVYHHITFGDDILTIPDVPAPIGTALKNSYTGIEAVTLISGPADHVIAVDENVRSENVLFVGPEFARMFSLELLQGTDALADARSVLVSKKLAASLTGGALGKVIKLDNRDLLTVAAVYEDFPMNSVFAGTDMLIPMAYYESAGEENREQLGNWEDFSFQCFVLLEDDASLDEVGSDMEDLLFRSASEDVKAIKPEGLLFPMDRWHLYADFKDGVNTGGQIRNMWMVGLIGIFVLLLACINFMNLSTARSERRSKEVGVRKVMGSARRQLMLQFLTESLLTVAIGFMLAVGIAALALPWFSEIAGRKMTLPWTQPGFMLTSIVFIIITGLLAGSYPAFYLSSFSPVKVLKGNAIAGGFSVLPRKVLVVFQFAVSIILIIGTVVVYLQIQHGEDRPPGFDRDGIFYMPVHTEGLAGADYNALRHQLLSSGVVENMATSDHPVTGSMAADASLTWEGKDPAVHPLFAMNSCSHDFPRTNGFQFVEGRDFSREYGTDSLAVIVNEMGAKLLSDGSVIGMRVRFGYGEEREIVGVIRDQVRWSPFTKQSPHLYYVDYSNRGHITVRLTPETNPQDALRKVEAVIKQFDPGAPFDYEFLDDDYAREFDQERRFGTLATVFSGLAVFISCIGIFGLSAFAASRRTKEIGVRKVLGASVFSLWKMLSGDFVRLAVVSVILASPLAYYLTSRWLEQYEYRTEVSWRVFAATAALVLSITLLTVSYQALRAAGMNPVKTLRVE